MLTNLQMLDNNNVCRACLSENISKISLLECSSELNVISIKDMLMECTSVYVSSEDNLPKFICSKCLEILQLAYNFKVQCKKSEEILLSLSDTKVTNNVFDTNELETKIDSFHSIELVPKIEIDEHSEDSQPQTNKPTIKKRKKKNCSFTNRKVKTGKCNNENKYKRKRQVQKNGVENIKKEVKKDKLYHCLECNVSYALKKSLHRHNREKHSTISYKCDVCDRGFIHHKVYFKHRIKHGHHCTVCYEVFSDPSSLQAHLATHESKGSNFICKECGKEYQQSEKLISHYKRHAENNNHLCTICGKIMSSGTNLIKHLKIHEEMPFLCKICNKKYRSRASWSYHMLSHDPSKEHPYVTCNVCGKLFKSMKVLRQHAILHVENRIKRHGCTYCDKRFDRSGDLRIHLRIHTGEKPYACKICELKFTQPNVLKNHLKIHAHSRS